MNIHVCSPAAMLCHKRKKIMKRKKYVHVYEYFTKMVKNSSCFLIYFLFSVLLQSFS